MAPLQRHPQVAPHYLGQQAALPWVAVAGAGGPWAGRCAHWWDLEA